MSGVVGIQQGPVPFLPQRLGRPREPRHCCEMQGQELGCPSTLECLPTSVGPLGTTYVTRLVWGRAFSMGQAKRREYGSLQYCTHNLELERHNFRGTGLTPFPGPSTQIAHQLHARAHRFWLRYSARWVSKEGGISQTTADCFAAGSGRDPPKAAPRTKRCRIV